MASVLSRMRASRRGRDNGVLARDQFSFLGVGYPHGYSSIPTTMPGSEREETPDSFHALIEQFHRRNGLIGAAVLARTLPFSEIWPVWEDETTGDRIEQHGSLLPVQRNNPGGLTRAQLFSRIQQDVSYAGNAFVLRLPDDRGRGTSVRRLRPDWVSLVLASEFEPEDVAAGADCYKIGYAYQPSGRRDFRTQLFGLAQVAHIADEPDPLAHYRGGSWVTSIVRELLADHQTQDHIDKFLANAATGNMVVKADQSVRGNDAFKEWAEAMDESMSSSENRWKNIYLAHGADVQVVGSMLNQLDMKNLTGGFESRIASRSRVPETILGTRGGNAGSALNASTYAQSRRLFAEHWFKAASNATLESLQDILNPPEPRYRLKSAWERILFLQEDAKDQADIVSTKAGAVRTLIDGGYEPASVAEAVEKGDMTILEHSGNLSVQLHPDGQIADTGTDDQGAPAARERVDLHRDAVPFDFSSIEEAMAFVSSLTRSGSPDSSSSPDTLPAHRPADSGPLQVEAARTP